MNFDFNCIYDGETVRVTGSISAFVEATRLDPAEGGEIEDFKVYAEDGTEMEDPDGKILAALEDDIVEHANDAASDAQADAAEARADREKDR